MLEVQSNNVWNLLLPGVDALCIPTCGQLMLSGKLSMSRGIAAKASKRWPWIDQALGNLIKANGNVPMVLQVRPKLRLITLPVREGSRAVISSDLVRKSAIMLGTSTSFKNMKKILVVGTSEPGWDTAVRPSLMGKLDDRFVEVVVLP